MDLFNRCNVCNSIIWGSYYDDNQGKPFCSDCAKCSQCHLKLADKPSRYYIGKGSGNFCCSHCKLKLLLIEQQKLEEKIAKLDQIKSDLERQEWEENSLPSCEKCAKRIKNGDYYYALKKDSDKKTCEPCYKLKMIEIMEEITQKVLPLLGTNQIIKLTDYEKSLLTNGQREIVDNHNQRIKNQSIDNPSKNKGDLVFYGMLLLFGVIYLCYYFYSVGKKKQKVAEGKE